MRSNALKIAAIGAVGAVAVFVSAAPKPGAAASSK
jgi:hypothetical protein